MSAYMPKSDRIIPHKPRILHYNMTTITTGSGQTLIGYDNSDITAERMKEHAAANAHRSNIFGLIYRAASDGRTSMMIVGPIADDVVKKLKDNGFAVQPTLSGHTVSW